ncbi:MAG: hypothetical protein ACO38Y_11195 [Steroidobacteraceae bacterium]
MPLQNRVNPFGEIFATDARGTFMGNRGRLHDDSRQIVRSSERKQWIICQLEWKQIRRQIMSPQSYTELFFLDEATALSAGHRPCGDCRVAALHAFQSAWALGMEGAPAGRTPVSRIDPILKRDRALVDGQRPTVRTALRELPDGAFIVRSGLPLLKWQGRLHRWSPAGYTGSEIINTDAYADVITPHCTVQVLRAGYVPVVHHSVDQTPPAPSAITG